MTTYSYTGLDKKGRKVSGKTEGEDKNIARKALKDQGVYVIDILEIVSSRPLVFSGKIRERDIVIAIRELATFVASNLPLDECLTGVTVQMKNAGLKKIFSEIQRNIREGKVFSEALKEHPSIFSPMIISLVRAGEETGTLDKILMRVADFLEKRQAFKSKIMSIMSYPFFMLAVSVAVFIFILTFVTPTITKIFSEIDMTLPGPTMVLMKLSAFFKTSWFYMIVAAGVLYYVLKNFLINYKEGQIIDFFRMRIPFLNNIILKKEISVFSSTISILIAGGVEIIESLKISGQVLTSPTLKREIREIIGFLSKGGALSVAFKNSRNFPYLVTQLVSAGERSGTLSEMFGKIADIYEEEVTQSSTRFVNFLEPAMILFMGGFVGIIVLAVLLPIFQISQSIR
ncbi:MAG TPA: type II secretion system F family protein [bacterium]|nr:type II secretion system F family protein [bacterium]